MRYDRFISIGLGVVALGWVVLVADMTVTEAMLRAGNLVAVISLRSDIVTIAQTAILTGFGLSLLGALRRGFAGLGDVMGTVASPADTLAMPMPMPTFADIELEPFDMGMPSTAPSAASAAPQIRPIPAAYQATIERPAGTTSVKERNYVILPNGAVEVETLLGTRIFASLDEARDFIR